MRDYVTCPTCGQTLDSDFATSRTVQDGTMAFFCNDRHAEIFLQQAS